ncbi:MAG: helix-turn-helix transcriptional regulator [Bacteroidota bacterium]
MELTQQLIFLFSALGAINGFALSSYFLLIKSEKRLSDYFLGGLLLMLSIRIIKSVFLHFNPGLFEVFIELGLTACALIGPFLLLYVWSVTGQKNNLKQRWWLYILPYVIVMGILSYSYSYYAYRPVWRIAIKMIYWQWFVYVILSGYYMRATIYKLWTARKTLTSQDIWQLNIYAGVAIIWLVFKTVSYTSYILGALSFSFIFYISMLLWLYKRSKKRIADDAPVKYANSTLDEDKAEQHLKQLEELMNTEKPYLNPKLTLTELSESLHLTSKELSQVINQQTDYNYSKYIASLRVAEAQKRLRDPKFEHLTIAAIAYDSGFNSLSSFNAVFKQFTGMTASTFRVTTTEV